MMNDNLDFLVSETFKHLEKNESELGGSEKLHTLRDQYGSYFNRELPHCPGLMYSLQKNGHTFVIRALETNDVAESFDAIVASPYDFPSLRLSDDMRIDEQLYFFTCPSVQAAKYLKKTLCHQRFPLFEEDICNISDPGFSWWLKEDDHEMTIYFKLSKTANIKELVKLGPLGDERLFKKTLKAALPKLKKYFSVDEFSHSGHFFKISSLKPGPYFGSFKALFRDGFVLEGWEDQFPELSQYALARSLWLKVLDDLA